MREWAEDLFKKVNGDRYFLNSVNIVETTHTGNQPFNEATSKRHKWVGEDDGEITDIKYPADRPNFEVAL